MAIQQLQEQSYPNFDQEKILHLTNNFLLPSHLRFRLIFCVSEFNEKNAASFLREN